VPQIPCGKDSQRVEESEVWALGSSPFAPLRWSWQDCGWKEKTFIVGRFYSLRISESGGKSLFPFLFNLWFQKLCRNLYFFIDKSISFKVPQHQ
jgi:hypothetical protein